MSINLELGCSRKIIEACKGAGLLRNQAAYVMATAYWETNHTVEPVIEAYWLSEAWRKKNLRYYPWHGRGFVQLTWESNYIKAGKALGVDMTTNPDVAIDPDIAAKVLVIGSRDGWFTGKKLSDYITLQKSDYKGARRIINSTDKAAEIAALAISYEHALELGGYGVEPVAVDVVDIIDEPTPTPEPATGLAAIINMLAYMFNKGDAK